jgi:serine/threonine protein kinase
MNLRANQIIHRDLKPDNIFLDEAWEPKIADFGFSKVVDPGISLNQSDAFGTPIYQAPEIFEEQECQYGYPVDVYAYGMLFNATVTGEVPYADLKIKGLRALRMKVLDEIRPRIGNNVDPKWKELIKKCWNGNPGNRPTFSDIVSQMSTLDFIGPQVDVAKFLAYQQKVVPASLWCQ